jgi:pilus assembly protein Flp/PilA
MDLRPQILSNTLVANDPAIFASKPVKRTARGNRVNRDQEAIGRNWRLKYQKFFKATLLESQNVRPPNAGFNFAILGRSERSMQKTRNNLGFSYEVPRRAMNAICRFVADDNAATAIEYCLIATGIALGIFVAVAGIEARINAEFAAINNSLK